MHEERRWLVPVGLAVVVLVVVANAAGRVGLGTSGPALVVTAAVALYCLTTITFLLWSDAPRAVTVALLLGMGLSATATHHGDPTGSGGIGLYLGVAFAPLRLPLRTAAAVSAVVVAAFDLQLALEAADPFVFVLVVDGGAAFFFLLGTLLRREQEQRAEVARLLHDLEASREAETAAAAVAERARLARELHDVLAHTLSGLVLQLEGARMLARLPRDPRDQQDPQDREERRDGELVAVLDRAHALARNGLTEARQAVGALRGTPLPGPESLPALVEEHRRATDGACRLTVRGEPGPLPPDARLALYRTAQEALSNVRAHAPGAEVDVRLDWRQEEVALHVESCGGGPGRGPGSGHGLTGMSERAQLLGGRLTAGPTATGFAVALRVPVQHEGWR